MAKYIKNQENLQIFNIFINNILNYFVYNMINNKNDQIY
jgi:hypothetical protein